MRPRDESERIDDTILVTGGAGFIGNSLVRQFVCETTHTVVNVDKLTYAGNRESLADVEGSPRYRFELADIADGVAVRRILRAHRPQAIVHLAAESHVDRSIDGPADFLRTNIIGTYTLLEAVRDYWSALPDDERAAFRFHHVSTDEVFGSLGPAGYFTEDTPYRPSSPYSATKAGSDHLVRAWHQTYGLPTLITNCSNNYGPFQFPEKLIPLMILTALEQRPLPIYGDGMHVRDWLYVEDHCRALRRVLDKGRVGQTYNIGGHNERTNLDVVRTICDLLDEMRPRTDGKSYTELITFVQDRPGHDRRYAIDASKIERELDWRPQETFESGLRRTVRWYLDHPDWWHHVRGGAHRLERLGVLT